MLSGDGGVDLGVLRVAGLPVSDRDWGDAVLTNQIFDIHRMSRSSYGSPRVHDELRLGEGIRYSRKRIERLMRQAGIQGIYRRKRWGCTRRDPNATPSADLVNRAFDPPEPDRLWMMDIERHEALLNPAVVKGHRLRFVAAGRLKLRAA